MERSGLIIGKFHPLHTGHQYVIETALARVDRLAVAIFDNDTFTIPGTVREAWINTLYPTAHTYVLQDSAFDYQTPAAWQEHEKLLRENIQEGVTHVFSSEEYGDKVAAIWNAVHVLVDKDRSTFPVSGREILKDPERFKDYLDPLVYNYLNS